MAETMGTPGVDVDDFGGPIAQAGEQAEVVLSDGAADQQAPPAPPAETAQFQIAGDGSVQEFIDGVWTTVTRDLSEAEAAVVAKLREAWEALK